MTRVVDGRFELVDRLGGGGMGWVWRARDMLLDREVALKEVRPRDPRFGEHDARTAMTMRSRVLREAQALGRVEHPNVVTVHEVIDRDDFPFPWIVMELVEGRSLQDRLAAGPLRPEEAAALGRGVLAGLRAAHAAGIQHRDIKPGNILLRGDGTPVLTDFGIAAIQGMSPLTTEGSMIGTPDYMAPERARGGEGGPAADLWSLALTLYVAVEGHHPLRRANALATLAAVLGEDIPPPRHAGRLAPALIQTLVRASGARPGAAALDGLLAQALEPPPAPPVPASATTVRLNRPAAAPAPVGGPARPGPPRPGQPTRWRPSGRRARLLAVALTVAALGSALWAFLPDDAPKHGAAAGPSGTPASAPAATGATTAAKTITIGLTTGHPGLAARNPDGTYAGVEVDTAVYIARELGYRPGDIRWTEVTAGGREDLLENKKADFLIGSYLITQDRAKRVDFVGPYLTAHLDVLLRDDTTDIRSSGDLDGKKICTVAGSSTTITVSTTVATRADVTERPGLDACIAALTSGEVDAVAGDDVDLAGHANQQAGSLRLAGFRLSNEDYGIGLPKLSPIEDDVRKALQKMSHDGTWDRSMTKNLPLLTERDAPGATP
ncbi:serine/threonine-protein kinase [Actinacidiphila bryophytorum]|uniref:non-specific serine/threonine protein kinase n=1 Tax=Actinacidiphila bryophytorum TaxID=1436133 RepID=A0A9W4ECW6_9ACTN|nr:serine/threonine-protein kinase [Actinacidiphila bryophytorum]MBM9437955.1 transporter substrate-binding domain-containing protein [Actinacidiphila bryophytorum]MBN6543137.1 transporter substrate-binding domain-containing protein [Actinacidiphila bryophytorum]CAG7617334.1 Non-specific serine/threonine protein kinase [Actinacidiphila bryophytorum]